MVTLEVVNLSYSFTQNKHTIPVLNEINFSVETGQLVALLGPSGCGKSTLFNIISGLLTTHIGDIYINGNLISGNTGIFGYMQQKDLLLQWRTVLKNVLIGPEIQKESLTEAVSEAHELLDQLGLQGFADSYPMQLSGGMRQRVALIRTLLFRKDVLLLDEPFGALDAMTRTVMQSILLDIWQKSKQTIILITHDIEEALLLADKIYILTARPATIKAEIYVPLPRPRVVTARELIDLKSSLYAQLKVEMQQVFDNN